MIGRSRFLLSVFLTLFIGLALTGGSAWATHLRAGEITAERTSCTSLTFKITITVYTDTDSQIDFGDGELYFGDGSRFLRTPTINETPRPDLGPKVGVTTFTTFHTYAAPGRYVISYEEPNRNAGILNVFNSVETRFYIETLISIDPLLGCSNTPKLLVPPIDKACVGAAWFHNPGAFDPDGDSLSFELTIPKKGRNVFVDNYRLPNVEEFYAGQVYTASNEEQDGPPVFSINPATGTIIWDAPGAAGEYNVAFLIKEWRKVGDIWVQLGYVTRDMQIIVEDCDNLRPKLIVPPEICVEAGTLITQDIFGTDPDGDSVRIDAFSEVFTISPSPASYSPKDVYQKTSATEQAHVTFSWQTECEHIKDQPYQVVFKITDKPSSGQKLVHFETWNIRVVGPQPQWIDGQIDLGTRTATLQWENYACENAVLMQVWRRVDQFAFDPPECVTGMPDFLGFTKIAEVPIATSVFVDNNGGKGLAAGAQYCYRLVAVFPLPGGGESYVSDDICLPPILADAPVITHVTVDRTDPKDGEIRVSWRAPFEADPGQFPPPYSYEVWRAEGFSGNINLTKVHPGTITDTTLVDQSLNTTNTIYNYRIIAFANNGTRVDESFTASSVRLETKSADERIELNWTADVPWSNQTQNYPYHLIYRGSPNDTEEDLVLIDSVHVNERNLHYIDSGQYQNTPLVQTDLYCYRVLTRGAYGNPDIDEPLLNFSQIICAQPSDDDAPCQPVIAVVPINCEVYSLTASCAPSSFSNTLKWNRPVEEACRLDIRSYNIYYTSKLGGEFELLKTNVVDTFYVDSNLSSFARCYKVSAVDRSGNESDLSEQFCFDNCPYYELPNVFTPYLEDGCNDVFSAFSDRMQPDENGNGTCGIIDTEFTGTHCARFVLAVNLKVFNRWGGEVYNYQSGGERSIYIDWDGHDNQGQPLSEGVYYYIANVTYDVVDPDQQNQVVKGWVHLIR